jgi:hypothetical protein
MNAAENANQNVGSPTPRRRRGVRLATTRNVCSELASTYRELKAGTLAPNTGRVRVYTLQVLATALQGIELEARLARLEDCLGLNSAQRLPGRVSATHIGQGLQRTAAKETTSAGAHVRDTGVLPTTADERNDTAGRPEGA